MNIELHILQNFPPHNLNRDDTGAPKDTEFGGYRRARISSQCLKRSIRWSSAFQSEVDGRIALRTKLAARRIVDILTEKHDRSRSEATIAAGAVTAKLLGAQEAPGKSSTLYYVGPDELEFLADELNKSWKDLEPLLVQPESSDVEAPAKPAKGAGKKAAKQADSVLDSITQTIAEGYKKKYKGQIQAIDIALFGRMLAEDPTVNIDASCQVAHAISTNRVSMDFDYFTAVDDLQPDDNAGAAMIGTVGFNSSCFYRYAVIDANQLAKNLGSNGSDVGNQPALDGIRGFIRGSVEAIPTGKQNTFAAQTPPAFVMTVVRPDGGQPMSLANAFERPVYPTGNGSLIKDSVAALDYHWKDLRTMYGTRGEQVFVAVLEGANGLSDLTSARCTTLDDLVEQTMAAINNAWKTEKIA